MTWTPHLLSSSDRHHMADSLLLPCRLPLVGLRYIGCFLICCALHCCCASVTLELEGTLLRLLSCSNQFLKQEAGSCVDIKKFAASKVCGDLLLHCCCCR